MDDKRLTGWTDERVAELRRLWIDQGLSTSQIAAELGGVTRNAVIGKLHRMGLNELDKVASTKKGTVPKVAKPRERRPAPPKLVSIGPKIKAEPFVVSDANDVLPRHLSLLELDSDECRWPYGDGPFTFCGCKKIDSGPYCYVHARIAGAGYGVAAFGSTEHRQKLSDAQKARHASRRSAA